MQKYQAVHSRYFSAPLVWFNHSDGGVCDNTKSILCLFSTLSHQQHIFIIIILKPKKDTSTIKTVLLFIYCNVFPLLDLFSNSLIHFIVNILRSYYFPSVTGYFKRCQSCCNFLFGDKSHWLLFASLENPRTKVQDKNIQCRTDSLRFISVVSVGVAGQDSWARGPL